jgi:hypothetical protein
MKNGKQKCRILKKIIICVCVYVYIYIYISSFNVFCTDPHPMLNQLLIQIKCIKSDYIHVKVAICKHCVEEVIKTINNTNNV